MHFSTRNTVSCRWDRASSNTDGNTWYRLCNFCRHRPGPFRFQIEVGPAAKRALSCHSPSYGAQATAPSSGMPLGTSTTPMPICRTCSRVRVSWTFLARGRMCCHVTAWCSGGNRTGNRAHSRKWDSCIFLTTCARLCAGWGDLCGTGVDACCVLAFFACLVALACTAVHCGFSVGRGDGSMVGMLT